MAYWSTLHVLNILHEHTHAELPSSYLHNVGDAPYEAIYVFHMYDIGKMHVSHVTLGSFLYWELTSMHT